MFRYPLPTDACRFALAAAGEVVTVANRDAALAVEALFAEVRDVLKRAEGKRKAKRCVQIVPPSGPRCPGP